MLNKVEGYGLVNENGYYLKFEQVSDSDVEVYSYDNPDMCDLFENKDEAFQLAFNIRKSISDFKVWIHEEDIPAKIVKVTKIYDINEYKDLSSITK